MTTIVHSIPENGDPAVARPGLLPLPDDAPAWRTRSTSLSLNLVDGGATGSVVSGGTVGQLFALNGNLGYRVRDTDDEFDGLPTLRVNGSGATGQALRTSSGVTANLPGTLVYVGSLPAIPTALYIAHGLQSTNGSHAHGIVIVDGEVRSYTSGTPASITLSSGHRIAADRPFVAVYTWSPAGTTLVVNGDVVTGAGVTSGTGTVYQNAGWNTNASSGVTADLFEVAHATASMTGDAAQTLCEHYMRLIGL
ncbi:hypothetical protein HQQ81_05610 [Microbacteriaceae bacterium VKM Ac-2854]|nr:hypothetical protein [Microbacteriaceae bacterium VKM Ac-2854]